MLDRLTVAPMSEDLILWRCLHAGPIGAANLDSPPGNPQIDFPAIRSRNLPLIRKLMQVYGACALVAQDGDEVVATLRFYPTALCDFSNCGAGLCMQQNFPAGPAEELATREFPILQRLPDKTLFVHCLLVVSPADDPGRYRRKGLASRLVRELTCWARDKGWQAIEATAYEEIPFLYDNAGVAGRRFWQKLGFSVVRQDTEPAMSGEWFEVVSRSALSVGIPVGHVANRYRMRLELSDAADTHRRGRA
jgi:hypothetical protein